MNTIETLIDAYLKKLNDCTVYHVFKVRKGKKYTKIMQDNHFGTSSCVHAFVDEQGNVYKPASFNAPAKGVRYNLFEPDIFDKMKVDAFGGYLYRNR